MMKIFLKKFSNCGCYLDFCIVYEVKGKKDTDFRLRKDVDNNDVSLNWINVNKVDKKMRKSRI